MNIQIFGTKKCNDTKKAERFFKERGIKFQFVDMKEKGMSKGNLIQFSLSIAICIIFSKDFLKCSSSSAVRFLGPFK